MVLYCVLKDRNADDGITDVMVRAEDASKINRIFERFQLATVDMGSVKSEIERSRREKPAEEFPEPERCAAESDKNGTAGRFHVAETGQGARGAYTKPRTGSDDKIPSVRAYLKAQRTKRAGYLNRERVRPSVRQELKDIKAEQAAKAAEKAKDRAEKNACD